MTQITLSDEQARQLAAASVPIILVDAQGRELGRANSVAGPTAESPAEEYAEIQRRMARSDAKWFSHAEMMERLRQLSPE